MQDANKWRTGTGKVCGIIINKMGNVLLCKVEELSLYMIAQQKVIDELTEKVRSLENIK